MRTSRLQVLAIIATSAALAFSTSAALADEPPASSEPPSFGTLRPQLQADVGLSVVLLAFEHPIGRQLAVELGAGIFGTYFLPWFDLGDEVRGLALGGRLTWFARRDGRGLYVAGYARGVAVRGDAPADAGFSGTGDGFGFTTGAVVGWAFGLTQRLDLRVGAGAQYIRYALDVDDVSNSRFATSTPFLALDAVLGWRL
jgi:hypothetical protein